MSHPSFAGLNKTINIVWPLEAIYMWAAVTGLSSESSITREGPVFSDVGAFSSI